MDIWVKFHRLSNRTNGDARSLERNGNFWLRRYSLAVAVNTGSKYETFSNVVECSVFNAILLGINCVPVYRLLTIMPDCHYQTIALAAIVGLVCLRCYSCTINHLQGASVFGKACNVEIYKMERAQNDIMRHFARRILSAR